MVGTVHWHPLQSVMVWGTGTERGMVLGKRSKLFDQSAKQCLKTALSGQRKQRYC